MGDERFRVAGVDPRLVEGIDKIDAVFALFDEHLRLLFCNVRYPQIRGYAIEVDLDILIERILVSPKSPTWIAMLIEDLVRRYGLKKSVEWSPLYKLNRLCHVGGVGPQTPAASLHCTLAFSMT